jgi:hypothetical protein
MTDLSKLTDDQLRALASQHGTARPIANWSDEELLKAAGPPPAPPMSLTDQAVSGVKSLGVGLGNAAIGIAGMPGDMQSLASTVTGIKEPPVNPASEARPVNLLKLPGSAEIKSGVEGITGKFYEPKTTTDKMLRAVGEFAPGAAFGPGGPIRRIGGQVVAPAIGSELAGMATTSPDNPNGSPYAKVIGALGATVAPAAIGRAITPLPATAERSAMVQALAGEGVVPTAGQRTGSKSLQYMESALGDLPGAGGGATAATNRSGEQFTAAVMRRIGENANRATPEVIDRAFNRIGGQFDAVAARNTMRVDPQFGQDLTATWQNYSNLVAPPNRAPAVENYIREVHNAIRNGQLPGEVYQSLRSRIEATARGARGNPDAMNALRDIRHALDDGMERSIAATGNPADIQAWREARNQYRNLLVVEKVAAGAGEDAATGLLSPQQMRQAVVSSHGQRNYARGTGDFAELVRAGNAVMPKLPQSGTAPRAAASAVPAILGGGAASLLGGGAEAVIPASIAATAAPSLVGRALMAPWMQNYLGNQVLAGPLNAMDTRRNLVLQSLMAPPRLNLEAQR